MGNVSCCHPQPINPANQQIFLPQDLDSKLSAGIDFVNLLNQHIQNKFFIDYKPSASIQTFIGINVQNLSSLHNFIKEIKLKDHESSIANVSDNKKLAAENNINTQCEMIVDQIKTALFELKKNTKKNVKALNFNQTRNNDNFVDTPYYLPWIQTSNRHVCVYIGEWKYQNRYLMRNFPHGVGRLYLNNQVWEGEIQLSIQKLQEFNESTIESIQHALNSHQTTTRQKIHMLRNNLTLQLNGQGRKFAKDDQYSGNFENGFLNGKGQYKNFKHEYSYQGTWIDSIKSGKGIQKTKSSKYQGQWKDNKKNGQGTLIFYISPQQQKQRQKQQKIFDQLNQAHTEYKHRKARVTIDMNLQQLSDKIVRQILNKNLTKYKGQQILTFQKLHYTPWEVLGFPFVNRNFVQNMKFQQLMKTNFCQKYIGQFVDDEFHGKGMYQWLKGNLYVGDWVKGKMQGLGKFFWKQGYVYYGQYKNDLKHGKGEMKWDPYKRHRGNWAFGKKHGYGQEIKIQLDQNQDLQIVIIAGLWKNNTIQKKDIYFSRCFPLQTDTNYLTFSPILKHNYFYYYPDVKLTQDGKFRVIQQEAKNYFKKPCNYCGCYILKQEKNDDKGYLQTVFGPNDDKGQVEKGNKQFEDPQICNNCTNKLNELQSAKKDEKNQQKIS